VVSVYNTISYLGVALGCIVMSNIGCTISFEKPYHKHWWMKSNTTNMQVVVYNVLYNSKEIRSLKNCNLEVNDFQSWWPYSLDFTYLLWMPLKMLNYIFLQATTTSKCLGIPTASWEMQLDFNLIWKWLQIGWTLCIPNNSLNPFSKHY
jgi:hypothetical protein